MARKNQTQEAKQVEQQVNPTIGFLNLIPTQPEVNQQIQTNVSEPEDNVQEAKTAQQEEEWDLGDIIDKETFMKLNFPERYDSLDLPSVSIIYGNITRKLNIRRVLIFGFLQNAKNIKKAGSLKKAIPLLKYNDSEEDIRKGLDYTMKWVGFYSYMYTELILKKTKPKQIIAANPFMDEGLIWEFLELVKEENKVGYLPIDKFVLEMMDIDGDSKIVVPGSVDTDNKKNIASMRNLLDIMERHLSNKLTPQDIAELKANIHNWEKDIEKLSVILNNLPDLEQTHSSK